MFIYVYVGNKMFVAMVHVPQALLFAPVNYLHLESSHLVRESACVSKLILVRNQEKRTSNEASEEVKCKRSDQTQLVHSGSQL